MSSSDPNDKQRPAQTEESMTPTANESGNASTSQDASPKKRILIGSQRDAAASPVKPQRDWEPIEESQPQAASSEPAKPEPSGAEPSESESSKTTAAAKAGEVVQPASNETVSNETVSKDIEVEPASSPESTEAMEELPPAPSHAGKKFPPPNIRGALSADLEAEFAEALGDMAVDDTAIDGLLEGSESVTQQEVLEEESKHTARVVAIQRDDVFVELGGREQGCIPLKNFDTPPEEGAEIEVIVQRLNPEDGIYELSIPNAAVSVDDWADIREGMLVEARITGHNTGGLECEVNHLRGFIPISQIALYRVEDLAEFVDQKFACLITEANPQRRNLVLSRRAVLEREREEAKQKLLESLEPGQVHEGVVRKLMDFGAFVDIGGLDGLLHISQLSWTRVGHPSEVLTEGQNIKVKIEKIDKATGKMSLAYRDMLDNPWDNAASNYPPNSVVTATVTKLMDFGAFAEVEPGVEGLIHISELSHKRVFRTSDAVHEGDKVEVMVLSVDTDAQRMSLSMKQTTAAPEPEKKGEDEPEPLPEPKKQRPKRTGPLKGGLGGPSGGEKFGLKW